MGTGTGQILSIPPGGGAATPFHNFGAGDPVNGLAWHPGEGRLYSCSAGTIYVHAANGNPTEFAGTVPDSATLLNARCLAVSPVDGKLYSGTLGGLIIRWDGPNNGTVVHTTTVPVMALAITSSGEIFYTTGGDSREVRRVTGLSTHDTWLAQSGAGYFGLSHDSLGRVYIAESYNDAIYILVSPNSPSLIFPASPGVTDPHAIAVDAQGNVWVGEDGGALKAFDPNGVPLVPYPIANTSAAVLAVALRH